MKNNKIIDIDRLSRYHETINSLLATKQESLVSGDNIKTINGESILGSGDIENLASKEYVDDKVNKLITNTELKFYCIEPVQIKINNEITQYSINTLVDLFLNTNDTFEIIPTSNNSIKSLYAYPGALDTYFPWLEGVSLFDGILFDMNEEEMYTKWSQGNQGLYNVQYAQYKSCIFWSDNPYISEVTKRTNYTLYFSSEMPLCYSTIPENTFKSFYLAYNVLVDPNWSNPLYKESFSNATWATQVFSYYGLHSIGIFDMSASAWNIKLPKDCRGLMYHAPNILNAGVFDAINVTTFGANSGSWRDAFADCYTLKNLYIINLKVSINISWSPISRESINYIISNAANTNNITIYTSPYTYYQLTDEDKSFATEKNITITVIENNLPEDIRWKTKQDKLVSGENIKTINGESLLSSGNITIPQIVYVPNEDSMPNPPVEGVLYLIGDEPDYIDLGLPSGTLWRNRNLGAESPEELGNFYCYGGVVPDPGDFSTKVNISDTRIKDTSYDAAKYELGENIFTPNYEDAVELFDNTIWELIDVNGTYGWKFTSKINGNSIFLPSKTYTMNTFAAEPSGGNTIDDAITISQNYNNSEITTGHRLYLGTGSILGGYPSDQTSAPIIHSFTNVSDMFLMVRPCCKNI